MSDIVIERIDKSDESRNPRFRYYTSIEGQANHLKRKCEERGISAVSMNGAVAIYAKRKIHEFANTIKESIAYSEVPYPEMTSDSLLCKEGRSVLGVYVKHEKEVILLTMERHFPDIKFHMYERRVPKFTFVRIFNSHKELLDYVQEMEHIII